MNRTPIDALLLQCPSMYKLVVAAAKRAKELADGSPKLLETDSKKVTTIALQEILKGRVQVDIASDEEGAEGETKTKRRSRTKAAAGDKKK